VASVRRNITMRMRYNSKIYSRAGVEEAVAAFTSVCTITLIEASGYITAEFSDIDPGLTESLFDEFGNYALYATIAGNK